MSAETTDAIAAALPFAVAFITGKITEDELRAVLTSARRTTA